MKAQSQKIERELPEIELDGRSWYVDVDGFQLIDKQHPETNISAKDMVYCEGGYSFIYSRTERNLVPNSPHDPAVKFEVDQAIDEILFVRIPNFAKMDPKGVARRYGLMGKDEDIQNLIDYNVMLDRRTILNGQHKTDVLDDRICADTAVSGKAAIELPYAYYCLLKVELYQHLMEVFPKFGQAVAERFPYLKRPSYDMTKKEANERLHKTGERDSTLEKQVSANEKTGQMQSQKRTCTNRKRMR